MCLSVWIRPARCFLACASLLLASRTALGSLLGLDQGSGSLYAISTTDASLTFIGNTGVSLGALEWSPDGTLYGISTGAVPGLYTIDPQTAAATLVGTLGNPIFVYEGALAFTPDGTSYAVNMGLSSADALFHVDLATGLAVPMATLPGEHDINGLAFRSDGLLVGLDSAMNALIQIDPANCAVSLIRDLSPLNRNGASILGSNGGMTMVGNTGYFATANFGATLPGSSELYAFDLFTGATTLVGTFGSGLSEQGFGALATPEPSTILLLFLAGTLRPRRVKRVNPASR